MEQTPEQLEYLQHLSDCRWNMVRHINGKGIEVSNNKFNVLPKAVKIVTEDDPLAYKDLARFKVKDPTIPLEIEDNSLDFVFITMENIPSPMVEEYSNKLVSGGRLMLHCKYNGSWNLSIQIKSTNGVVPYEEPVIPKKNIGIMRLGAIGDLLQVTSVAAQAKKMGYHVTVYGQNPAATVLQNNPNIDEIVGTDRNIIRNNELQMYWDWLETKHERWVNLCGSVEVAWLPNKNHPQFHWPDKVRNKYLNANYVAFMHELAGLPYKKLDVKFYPTDAEINWAKEERSKMPGKKLLCYAMNGSSLHKVWPYFDTIVARTMLMLPDVDVVTLGGDDAVALEGGWQEESRVHCRSGAWSIRQSLTFIQLYADVLVGPETGLLNGMCCEPMKKVLFLSHSSKNNLSRDWHNTESLSSECCGKCLHRLHLNDDGWKYMERDDETGVAKCQAQISPDTVWNIIYKELK